MHFSPKSFLFAILLVVGVLSCLAVPVPDVDVSPASNVQPATGTFESSTAPQIRKALNDGVDKSAGGSQKMKALVQAMASYETSFATNMPTEANQRSIHKFGTAAQEMGPMRMSRQLLSDLGYSEADMARMNSLSYDGVVMAAQAVVKGIKAYGYNDFMQYQRGGITRFSRARAGILTEKEKKDTASLVTGYQQVQKAILDRNLVSSNGDSVPFSGHYTEPI